MPHINIKYFPVPLSQEQKDTLVTSLTNAARNAFGCDAGVISIALEPIGGDAWNEQVYIPEIKQRKQLLCKVPNY